MIGEKITRLTSVDSSNNYVAKQLISGTWTPGEVILAHFQTEGRGRRGRFWQSEPGENLTFSFAIDSNFLPDHQNFLLSKAISVAVYTFLSEILNAEIWIKWPNDTLVSGKKISGMLIENKMVAGRKHSIVGIGLNANQMHFPEGIKATSLALEIGQKVNVNRMLSLLLAQINTAVDQLVKNDTDYMDEQYIRHLFGTDRWVEFEEEAGRFQGIIRAVDHEGVLLVKSRQGRAVNYRSNQVKITY